MPQRLPIGLIGIGLMGQAFAERLMAAGFAVLGFDVDPAKSAWLAARGGGAASSIAEVARGADPILIAVFSTDQVEEVVDGQLVPALAANSRRILLCTSTCDPDTLAALGQRAAAHGLAFLEVPVSGTSEQVRRHEGVALIGGEEAVAAEVAPVLDALFASRFHIGASATPAAPSSPSTSFSGSTAWRWPKAWCSRSGSGSIRQPSSTWRAARPPIHRSWTPRETKWCAATSPRKGACARRSRMST